jgi:aminoglycoside phosphotransferase (APT) family kinase protein
MSGPLDLDALSRLLDAYDVKTSGTLRATLIAGGRSNLTYRVDDDVSTWVVRRPPTSGLTPSAHDMAREFRVTEALQHSDVPVARAVALDPDGSLMGAPVSVVEFVAGTVVRSRDDLEALSDEQINRLSATLVDTLVRLHSVDYTALGLVDFGRPDGFVTRQVRRWAEQWNRVRSRDLPDVEQLIGKLGQRVPTTTASSLIHGDYRIDNTIVDVHSHEPLQAIVDWELSTLGDPLTDVALMCVYRDSALDDILGFPAAWTSPRWPTEHTLAQRYSQLSGRDLSDWPFYIGLAHLKLAVIAEGIAHRAASTNAGGLKASGAVPHLAAAGLVALG